MSKQHERLNAPLLRLDLTCAAQITLWFLRRASELGRAETERAARHIFGPKIENKTIKLVGILGDFVRRSPIGCRAFGYDFDLDMTAAEFDFLTALAHAQRGGNVSEITTHWGWPAANDVPTLDQVIRAFAKCLSYSGRTLPDPWDRPVLASMEAAKISELDPREVLLVDAVRQWVRRHLDEKDGFTPMLELLAVHGLDALAMPLHTTLRNTIMTASRRLVVHCPKCKKLSHDEARLLHAISAMQRNDRGGAMAVLCSWLPHAAARLTLPAIDGISRTLLAAGHRIPLRAWNLPAPDQDLIISERQPWEASTAIQSAAVH